MKERYILSFWSGKKTEKKKCLITKHAKGKEKQYVRMCYDAVPKQLAKELKKFQYSTVEKGQTRRKFGGSVQWLRKLIREILIFFKKRIHHHKYISTIDFSLCKITDNISIWIDFQGTIIRKVVNANFSKK